MKIDVTEDGTIRLKQLYNSIVCKADDKQIAICERDGGFEIGVYNGETDPDKCQYYWYVVSGEKIAPLGFRVAEILSEDVEELATILDEVEDDN